MQPKTKILIIADDATSLKALAERLGSSADTPVVGALSGSEELLNTLRTNEADITLMKIDATVKLADVIKIREQDQSIKIIVLLREMHKESVVRGIEFGIDGCIPEYSRDETLNATVLAAGREENHSSEIFKKMVLDDGYQHEDRDVRSARKANHELTKREGEILEHAVHGKTNAEVAISLRISVKTVEAHKARIREKLGLRNTVALVKYAIKNNIISI